MESTLKTAVGCLLEMIAVGQPLSGDAHPATITLDIHKEFLENPEFQATVTRLAEICIEKFLTHA